MSDIPTSVEGTMKKQAYMIVIICSLLLHVVASFMLKRYVLNMSMNTTRICMICMQGIVFFLYPVLGHIADVCLSRYRTIMTSVVMLIVSGTIAVVLAGSDSAWMIATHGHIHNSHWYSAIGMILCACVSVVAILGIGLFEANAIQFGLDQLLEASTPKLISFIHWYYILESECWRHDYVLYWSCLCTI